MMMFVKEEEDYNQFNELNQKLKKKKEKYLQYIITEKIFWYHAITT